MIHLIIGVALLVGSLYFVVSLIGLACRVVWLCVLLAVECVLICITVVLGTILGVQKVRQLIGEWKWRRRYGEVLPREWPDPWTKVEQFYCNGS
jgi:hypothetical protein